MNFLLNVYIVIMVTICLFGFLGTVHYLYPRGGGGAKWRGDHVKFILSYGGGGYLLFWSPEGGVEKTLKIL